MASYLVSSMNADGDQLQQSMKNVCYEHHQPYQIIFQWRTEKNLFNLKDLTPQIVCF